MDAYPTETEEKYLSLVVDENMWTDVCVNMEMKPNVDNAYLDGQLKNNTELNGLVIAAVIKLAIHRRLNLPKYQMFVSVEGV
jgi:hypothetical protein